MRSRLLLLGALGCTSPAVDDAVDLADNAAAVTVCGASVQAAIDAAAPGTTLDLCPGTYAERLSIVGKALTLRGAGGPGATIIDAGGLGRALEVVNVGAPGVVVKNLTLRNGVSAASGGGVRCSASKLTLSGVVLIANRAAGGGGLAATGCALTVVGSRFDGNRGGSERGGGAWLVNSTGLVATSVFTGNKAGEGGAVAIDEGTVQLRDSQLTGNTATVRGGGLYHASNATVRRVTIADNQASWIGGGVYVFRHAPVIRDSDILGNRSVNDGGGLYIHRSEARLYDNLIADNVSPDDGGGVRAFESRLRLERNTLQGNEAGDGGGGIRLSHLRSVLIDNVVLDNVAGNIGGGIELDNDASSVSGGLVQGNRAHRGGGLAITLTPTVGAAVDDVEVRDNDANYGGGLYLADNFNPVALGRLAVAGNEAGRGAGVYLRATHATLARSVLERNVATIEGGAIVHAVASPCVADQCPPAAPTVRVEFVTAWKNSAPAGSALWTNTTGLTVENAILFQNAGTAVTIAGGVAAPTWRFNDTRPATFAGMAAPTGVAGNLSVDPELVAPAAGDFHLATGSACVDAGDPSRKDVNGTRADMGRHGGPGPQ